MTQNNRLVTKTLPVGADMRAVGLSAPPPPVVRTLDGGVWERPFAAETNYSMRQPRSGAIMREFQNSECVTWGAARKEAAAGNLLDLDVDPEAIEYDYLQRWHFAQDFECYGMWFPIWGLAEESAQLRLKLALFRDFPIENTTQAWRMLPGAKFTIDVELDATLLRRVFIPFDPSNHGRLIIPSGWYWLFIMPGSIANWSVYSRIVRDYPADNAVIWRSDRRRAISPTVDWFAYDYEDLVFVNDGTAPPIGTTSLPPTAPIWPQIDFAFAGRNV